MLLAPTLAAKAAVIMISRSKLPIFARSRLYGFGLFFGKLLYFIPLLASVVLSLLLLPNASFKPCKRCSFNLL